MHTERKIILLFFSMQYNSLFNPFTYLIDIEIKNRDFSFKKLMFTINFSIISLFRKVTRVYTGIDG